jgi:purine-binding chemotaxis protein CheW
MNPAEPTVQLCAFYLGREEFAVDLMRVEEILQPQPVTAVPRAPAFVEGVVNLRGTIVPVVDLRKRLGTGEPPPRVRPKLLVCLLGQRRIGLMVDGVSEVSRVARSALKPAPALHATGSAPHVIGAYGPPSRLRLLLDLKVLLTPEAEQGQAS